MIKRILTIFICIVLLGVNVKSQIAANYEVGTWFQFKTAALTYSFDDGTSNQLSVAMPMFDKYGYKMSFNVVTNWVSNWDPYKNASQNGHEIASHTVTHLNMQGTSAATQDPELKNSQSTINNNITNAKCLTIIYPNCNIGDVSTMSKYYISGRTCSGQINGSNITDYWNISSVICGDQGLNSAQALNDKANSAKNSKGWCVFLIHGIDGQGNYSPLSSSVLSSNLSYINSNSADYWVATQLNVVKYIKERMAAKLTETTITADSLKAVLTDGLDNSIYDAKLSFRRLIPTSWAGAKVYLGSTLITSTTTTINGSKYVNFDVAPDKGDIAIVNTASSSVQTPTVTSPVNYCQGVTAVALTATGTSLKWYTVATGGSGSTTAPVPATNVVANTTYYVSQTVNNVESARASIVVNVSASPSVPTVTTPQSYCQNVTATALSATGTALKWYNTPSGGSPSTTAPIPTTTVAGTTTYYVTQTVNTCESARQSIVVTVNPSPSKPIVTTPISIEQGTVSSSLTATGTNLKWYTTSTGGTGSSNAPKPNTSKVGNTSYYVSQTVNGCESDRAEIVVIVAAPIQTIQLNKGWNYIGCPLNGTTSLSSALSSIWPYVESVKTQDEFYSISNPSLLNSLQNVVWGEGYLVKLTAPCILDWTIK